MRTLSYPIRPMKTDTTKNLSADPPHPADSDQRIVRDDLPSGVGTVLSRRPLSDAEKAEIEIDVIEARKSIIADLEAEGKL